MATPSDPGVVQPPTSQVVSADQPPDPPAPPDSVPLVFYLADGGYSILEVLLEEYKLAETRLSRMEDRVLQLVGIAFPALTATATGYFLLTSTNPASGGATGATVIPIALSNAAPIAAVIPFAFLVLFSLVIYVLYFSVAYLHYCRIVADQINSVLDTVRHPELLMRFKASYPQAFYSIRFWKDRGNEPRGWLKPRVVQFMFLPVYIVFIGASAVVFILTVWASAEVVTSAKEANAAFLLDGIHIWLFYSFWGIVLLISLIGVGVLPGELERNIKIPKYKR